MREGDLARPRRAAPADQPGRRDRVVGRPKRAFGREPAVTEAGDAVDAGDLEGLVEARGRQDPRQPPREHRLPGARRTDHQQVVSAGRGDLQRTSRSRLGAPSTSIPSTSAASPAFSAGTISRR
jgi:hypothetical protein